MALILCTRMGDWRSSLVMEQSFTLRDVFRSDFDLESLHNRQVVASSIWVKTECYLVMVY